MGGEENEGREEIILFFQIPACNNPNKALQQNKNHTVVPLFEAKRMKTASEVRSIDMRNPLFAAGIRLRNKWINHRGKTNNITGEIFPRKESFL